MFNQTSLTYPMTENRVPPSQFRQERARSQKVTSRRILYTVSRAVATALAFRSFMTEFGFPQRGPTEVKNDNSGTVAKAASDASDK